MSGLGSGYVYMGNGRFVPTNYMCNECHAFIGPDPDKECRFCAPAVSPEFENTIFGNYLQWQFERQEAKDRQLDLSPDQRRGFEAIKAELLKKPEHRHINLALAGFVTAHPAQTV